LSAPFDRIITIDFEKGDPVAIDGVKMSPATLLAKLNDLGRANGIGHASR
jgi:argininosuccinate synthase